MLKHPLLAAIGLAAALSAHAELPPNIALLPYCDTLQNLSKDYRGIVTGMWESDCDGIPETQIAGPYGKGLSSVPGRGMSLTADTYPRWGYTEMVIVREDGTYAILYANGDLLASGTWAPIAEAAGKRGNRPANAR